MKRSLPAPRVPPLLVEGCLAVFFIVLTQVELGMDWDDGYHAGPLLLNRALQVLVALPLLLRRSRPRLAFALMCAAIAAPALVTARTLLFWGDMLPLTLTVFTLARSRNDAWAMASAPVATLACATVAIHNDQMPLSDAPFALVLFGAAELAGLLVGRLTEQRRQLTDALARLADEQEGREQAAVQDERRRIAVEMHDVIAHAVSLMTIQVGAARLRLETAGQLVPGELRVAEESGRQALSELRRALGVMRQGGTGGDLAPVPGIADLPALLEGFTRSGLDITAHVQAPEDLPDSIQLAVYRIVQESLTNAVRHAGPVRVDIQVARVGGELRVTIRNAAGRPTTGGGGGHGIAGMQERVAMFGGSLTTSRPDDGFFVAAHIPIPDPSPVATPMGVPS